MKTSFLCAAMLASATGLAVDGWSFDNCSQSQALLPFAETNAAEIVHGVRIADADVAELYGYWQKAFPAAQSGTYRLTFKMMTADMAVGVWVPQKKGDYCKQIPPASGERHRSVLEKFLDAADLQTFSDREWRDFACDVDVKEPAAAGRVWVKLGTMGGSAGWMKFKDVSFVRKEVSK